MLTTNLIKVFNFLCLIKKITIFNYRNNKFKSLMEVNGVNISHLISFYALEKQIPSFLDAKLCNTFPNYFHPRICDFFVYYFQRGQFLLERVESSKEKVKVIAWLLSEYKQTCSRHSIYLFMQSTWTKL